MIEFVGDVGAGKTTFIQGLAAGLGVKEDVVSPTFTLERSYPTNGEMVLHHFDFYRLGGRDIVTDELGEVAGKPKTVTAIEWATQGEASLPEKRLQIIITPESAGQARHIEVKDFGANRHIIKGLQHDSSA